MSGKTVQAITKGPKDSSIDKNDFSKQVTGLIGLANLKNNPIAGSLFFNNQYKFAIFIKSPLNY